MNRWYFWVLAPVMLVTAVGLPFIVDPPTPSGRMVLDVFSAKDMVAFREFLSRFIGAFEAK